MLTLNPAELSIPVRHQYLIHAVAPRPIAFVSTVDKEGNPNLAPFSFFNCFGSNPPTLVFSPARSGRTGATKHTYQNVLEVPECVVNIAHSGIIHQMNLAGHMYEKGINEFEKSGLTPLPSLTVKPARVAECYVQFECVVQQVISTGEQGAAGNLIICEVKMMHIDEKVLDEQGSIDPFKMDYVARMGKEFWCRVGRENIFSVSGYKMANEVGVGWNALPSGITRSEYLSANDVAQIASLHRFPTEEEKENLRQSEWVKGVLDQHKAHKKNLIRAIHRRAKAAVAEGHLPLAFGLLMLLEE